MEPSKNCSTDQADICKEGQITDQEYPCKPRYRNGSPLEALPLPDLLHGRQLPAGYHETKEGDYGGQAHSERVKGRLHEERPLS